jgi:thymidylate synthase (FAD)
MKAIYLNHSLSDTDVANIARQSFAKRAEEYTEEQNHNLIKYLARGMASKDWDKLMEELLSIESKDDAEALAVHLRNIPEHWVPFGHPQITLRMQAPIPIRVQC